MLAAVCALLLTGAELCWWQARAATEHSAPPPSLAAGGPASEEPLSFDHAGGLRGAAPPEADPVTREQKRFDPLDCNREGRIAANEMLAPSRGGLPQARCRSQQSAVIPGLAVRTIKQFSGADANHDGALTRKEFATTKRNSGEHLACRCSPMPKSAGRGRARLSAPIED